MARYFTNELSFELPPFEYVDRTLHLFESNEEEGTIGLVVARAEAPSVPLEQAVTVQLARQSAELERHQVIQQTLRTIAQREVLDVADRFRLQGGALFYRRSLHILAGEGWLQVSASGPMSQRAHCDRRVEAFVASMRVRPDLS